MGNSKAIAASFMIGVVSLTVGFAFYYGELALINSNPTVHIAKSLAFEYSTPGWIIGAVSITAGIVLVIKDP